MAPDDVVPTVPTVRAMHVTTRQGTEKYVRGCTHSIRTDVTLERGLLPPQF
jgi:hypothetical protein